MLTRRYDARRGKPKGCIMDIETFVAESLRQIVVGVHRARDACKEYGTDVAPATQHRADVGGRYVVDGGLSVDVVEFDVAVESSSEHGGKGQLNVVVGSIGGGTQSTQTSHSRVRFTVPIAFVK